jgi:DNA sulfur modification protein DndD
VKISLLGWESQGLRCPDVAINLIEGDGPAQVSLIQMPNGTGKTTTLKMLEASLSGSATRWSPEEIRELRRPGDDRTQGLFVVRLAMNGRPLTFEINLDFDRGQAQYRTTSIGSGGVKPKWDPPNEIRRFLDPKFLDLFVFDGEFANRLFDASGLEAEGAIDALCQLYLLEEVGAFAEGVWARGSKLSPGKSDATLTREEKLRDTLAERHSEAQRRRDEASRAATDLQGKIDVLDRKIKERLGSVESTRDRYKAAQIALVQAENDLSRVTGETIASLRDPLALHAAFAETLWNLKNNLDELRLPGNTSAQFFAELVKKDDCICGREMTTGAAAEITKRSAEYLDDDSSGFLNALKQDIDRIGAPAETETTRQTFDAGLAVLLAARRQKREAQQTVELLERQLIDEGDEQLKGWQIDRKAAVEKLEGAQELLRLINAADNGENDSGTWSLTSLDRQLAEVRKRIAEITDTLKIRAQTDLLQAILERTGEIARADIKSQLIEVCNERLRTVLLNDPLRIASIDGAVRLSGQAGASVGQVLSVGYVFLMSVLNRGGNDLPLIVDSPANPIDAGVRRRIGALIPKLCNQFVGFTINTEREGFVPALQAEATSMKYLTLFRRTDGTQRLMTNLPPAGVTQTDNAVLVEGQAFFETFDLEDEDA